MQYEQKLVQVRFTVPLYRRFLCEDSYIIFLLMVSAQASEISSFKAISSLICLY